VEQAVEVSTDRGRTWKPVWAPEEGAEGAADVKVDLSEHVVPGYEYLLRFRISGEKGGAGRLERLAINTAFQHNPRVYPAVLPGENRMRFLLGEETETQEILADLTSADAFLKDVKSYRGVWFRRGQISGKLGQVGEIVYELAPPRPGTVASFSAHAGLRREPFGLNWKDDVKISYALDEPGDWKVIYDDEFPPWGKHWCYHANGKATCPPGTKKVFVKYTISTASSASIQRIRLYMHWRPEGPGGLPPRGVRVEHGWTEGGEPKTFEKVFRKAPAEYVVKTGADAADSYLTIEPVRSKGLAWRENDPPVKRPEMPEEEVLDEKLREEMRSSLRAIDADPKTGLPKAAKSSMKWLSGNARAAGAMLRAKYPVKPRPPDPTTNPLKDEAGTAAAKKTMAGPDSYAKLKLLAGIRAANISPVPDLVLEGLKDPSRYVRLEVVLAVRRAPSEAGIKALEETAKKDPLEFLREEAKLALAAIKKKE
ncbi:MAG: HEAT repeat domain-containing protein, partial [Planctomycetota bacterium]